MHRSRGLFLALGVLTMTSATVYAAPPRTRDTGTDAGDSSRETASSAGGPVSKSGSPAPTPGEPDDRQTIVPTGNPAPTALGNDPISLALATQPGGLTAEQVAERSSGNAPSITRRHADLEVSVAKLNQTLLRFLPRLSLDATYQRVNPVNINLFGSGASVGALNPGPLTVGPCPFDPMTQCVLDAGGSPVGAVQGAPFKFPLNQVSFHGNLSIPLSDYVFSLVSARKGAIAERESASIARDAEVLKVKSDARIAYYNWVKAVARVAITQKTLENTQARLADAQRGYSAGITAKVDLARFDAIVAQAEAAVVDAKSFESLAAENLAMLMGDMPGGPGYQIGEDVLGVPPRDASLDRPLADLISEAESQRLELSALRRRSDAVHEGIKAARASYYPRLNAFADAIYARPNQRFFFNVNEFKFSWAVGLTLSWSINDTLLTKAQVREYKANSAQVDANLEELRRGIVMEVQAARAERERVFSRVSATQRALASADEGYANVVRLYQAGRATATDVIEAETDRVRAVLDAIDTNIDLRVADLKLRYAIGQTRTDLRSRP